MRLDPPLRTTAPSPAVPEQELVQITDELIEAIRQGRLPDREALLARFPQHADRLDGLIQAAEMVVDLRASGSGNESGSDSSGSIVETEVPKQLGDFEILREIGKGGMGVVYEARQISLQRRVALKILPFASVLDSRQLQRFKNESLAAAQLNHPHIVDVYGVGCERGVHYYAMRLIDGQSLAEILAHLRRANQAERETETDRRSSHQPDAPARDAGHKPEAQARDNGPRRGDPSMGEHPTPSYALRASVAETPVLAALSTDRGRRTEFFRTVARIGIEAAEALHHAHEQGVIHRDVKPSNLLIDGRGRVWVADFGLAHIETGAELTLSGELMGTLRYMSPEQASGQRLGIDHRTDVYSLGVTLYELLTLRAPFEAPTRSELLRQILFDEPRPPRKLRKDVPVDLETIVLKCLEKSAGDRYASAGEVAEDLRRFAEDREIRGRRTSVTRRISKWARRRKPLVAATAAVLAASALIGTWAALSRVEQRSEATRLVNEALQEVKQLQGVAQAKGHDLAAWTAAVGAARRAEAIANHGPIDNAVRRRAIDLLAELRGEQARIERDLAEVERDERMLAALQRVRPSWIGVPSDEPLIAATCTAYLLAFRQYGVTLDSTSVAEAASALRTKRIRTRLIEAILDWSMLAAPGDHPNGDKLLEIAALLADENPGWHRPFIHWRQNRIPHHEIRKLATASGEELPSAFSLRLADILKREVSLSAAIDLLHSTQQRWPNEFEVNEILGFYLLQANPPRGHEALRFLTAAVALQPQNAVASADLASALLEVGDSGSAVVAARRAVELDPDYAVTHNSLAAALMAHGDVPGALAAYRRAAELSSVNLRHDGFRYRKFRNGDHFFTTYDGWSAQFGEIRDDASTHAGRGVELVRKGDLHGAISEYRRALQLNPDDFQVLTNLGICLYRTSDHNEASATFRRALELRPEYLTAHLNFGFALTGGGSVDEGIAAYRRALELESCEARTFYLLADAFEQRGDVESALSCYHRALALNAADPFAFFGLGNVFLGVGRVDDAIAAYRRALELEPDFPEAHNNLGIALSDQGDLDGAITAFRRELELKPDEPLAHNNLGATLRKQGDLDSAITAFRRALEWKPDYPEAHFNLGLALENQGNRDGAIAAYRRALEFMPDYLEAHLNLGIALWKQDDRNGAIAAFRRALELKPDDPVAHNNLGVALRDQGDLDGAIIAFRRASELEPDDPEAHSSLGAALAAAERVDEAIAVYREAIRIQPDLVAAVRQLGFLLQKRGDVREAIAAYCDAITRLPDCVELHVDLAAALQQAGEADKTLASLPHALELLPDSPAIHHNLGSVLEGKGESDAAIAAYRRAIALDADNADAHWKLGRILRKCERFAESLQSVRRAHDIGSKQANWAYPSTECLDELERLVHLNDILLAVLHGEQKVSATERIELAEFALMRKHMPQSAARLFRDAFAEEPSLAEDPNSFRRYNAACGALMTSVPSDPPMPHNLHRAAWRALALDWLRADLAAWRQLADAMPDSRSKVDQALTHWRQDPDLSTIRDSERLSQLPDAERQLWEQLWLEVDELQKSMAAE